MLKPYFKSHHWRTLHALLTSIALTLSAAGCSTLDPQHVLTRKIGNTAPAQGFAMDATTRQQAFDFVWNRINDAYVDPHLNGVNWQQVRTDHQAKILEAATDDIFWKSLDTMVAELRDAHTRVLSSQQYANDKLKQGSSLGLSLVQLNGELIVSAVFKGSAADHAGIVKGNKLVMIDGLAAAQWWSLQLSKTRKNSSERAQLKSVRRVFNSGDPEFPSDRSVLTVERNDTSLMRVTLTRTVLRRKDTLVSTVLPSGIGYMRLTGFDAWLLLEVVSAFSKIKNTPALVIDLRGNGGGAILLATEIMNHLVEGEVQLGKKVTRSGQPPRLLMGLVQLGSMDLKLRGVKTPYLAPVAILVDGDSASASEYLAGSLQNIGRAEIVGETTCGCLLGYLGYANVPGGGALAYSELDMTLINGKRIEGVGVIPDHAVALSREDLVQGVDRALAQALVVLQRRADR